MYNKHFIQLSVSDETSMQAYVSVPHGDGPFPALIVYQEAFGVNQHIQNVCDRFAAEGFLCIAPELFHRTVPAGFTASYTDFAAIAPHMQAMTIPGMEADIRSVWDWLIINRNVQEGHIGCIGYCMGGRMSFLTNCILPVKAAVSYYGGRIAPDLVKRAPALHAPMLFFWGGLDKHITAEQIHIVTTTLKAEKKDFISTEISYADHGFACDERESYNAQATKEALAMTLTFLRTRLD